MGMEYQMPWTPIVGIFDKRIATGILIIQREKRLINMGMKVSPAPLRTPFRTNMVEKRM